MTQRKWETTDGWSVLAGWDRPLHHFFVSIDRQCRACNGDGGFGLEPNDADMCGKCQGEGNEYLFNNLSDTTGMTDLLGGMSIDQVKRVLDDKLTQYPQSVLSDLVGDQIANAGNHIQVYDTVGAAKQ